jgi:ribosomal-protein-alanine N-acetyltransferase
LIRRAFIDDIDAIVRIENSSFDNPWSRASIEAEFSNPYSKTFLFAETSAEAIAFIMIWVLCPEGEIVSLAVDPLYRRKGIARALINYVLENFPNILWALEVGTDNTPALKVYDSCSFVKRRRIKNYYGKDRDAFLMTLNRRGEKCFKPK